MTILVTMDVQCDVDNCLVWTPGVTGHENVSKSEARKIAKSKGWVRHRHPGGPTVDLCPWHAVHTGRRPVRVGGISDSVSGD